MRFFKTFFTSNLKTQPGPAVQDIVNKTANSSRYSNANNAISPKLF
jgi:hypothetical protein